jgi:hypothetical protein
MIARTLITTYYITCFAAYVLVLLYLVKLENKDCIVDNNLHYTVKNSIYAGLGVSLAYIVLLGFAYITNDNILLNSLKNVFHIVMIIVNGVITITLFIYMIKMEDFECDNINDKNRYNKVYNAIKIICYILLCFYAIYFSSYLYYKYIMKPRIILIDNIQPAPVMMNNTVKKANNNVKRVNNNNVKMNNGSKKANNNKN